MRFLMITALLLALAGCTANVVTDYKDTAMFGSYGTWAFAPNAGAGSFVSLDGSRVRAAVEREMKREALRQVPEAEADLLVNWQIVEEERLEQVGVGVGIGFGRGPFGWGMAAPPPVREVKEGKLVLELVDTSANEVVWRAVSRRYLKEFQSSDERRELIDEVVAEMFSQYPPAPES
ncbi:MULTISPECIES: DUF4136 domain-containing protein [Marinobacter]|uniref:DUF4136 domain-containing protein n=1 Tax=Marinobacter suaedae TaxID=3057675 RepID=A0ABT8VWX3_9GAMM|nr:MULTISPECIES: DUF4136 domain-containing protein [unclassified Marinobacter]MBZ2168616.1 DUF4136 domain-containing protein [Marinobacter sp. F4216]MDO3720500.1 DUF4136 domain-containing protein [Marinobacter sp. chi1]